MGFCSNSGCEFGGGLDVQVWVVALGWLTLGGSVWVVELGWCSLSGLGGWAWAPTEPAAAGGNVKDAPGFIVRNHTATSLEESAAHDMGGGGAPLAPISSPAHTTTDVRPSALLTRAMSGAQSYSRHTHEVSRA
jgi:hypothetical protein